MLGKVASAVAELDKPSPVIAALGLAFKPDIDDLRESPAMDITAKLSSAFPHAQVLAVEPNVSALPAKLEPLANVHLADITTALEQADIVLLLVDHKEFKALSPTPATEKKIIDTKGVWQ